MANEKDHSTQTTGIEAQLQYSLLEQNNIERTHRNWPAVILTALLVLFVSSGAGIALAVVLMINPVEGLGACLSRDLILFGAGTSLLYICVHVKGALQGYTRSKTGPPQIFGNYLHATALLMARLAIGVWIAALVATAIMIAKAVPLGGWADKLPFLDILICVAAVPSLMVISCSIEWNPTPFATAGISRTSTVTCRVSDFADDLAADLSVSRRGSVQQADRRRDSVGSLATAEVVRILRDTRRPTLTDVNVRRNSMAKAKAKSPIKFTSFSCLPITSKGFEHNTGTGPSSSRSPPQPIYYPGGRRYEWNQAGEMDIAALTEYFRDPPTVAPSAYSSSHYSNDSSVSSQTSSPGGTSRKHRVTPSTSIASLAQRSGLSTVRYAERPDVAVQPVLRVVGNHCVTPEYSCATDVESYVTQLPPLALLRGAQQPRCSPSQTGTGSGMQRRPSNFSRPILRDETVPLNFPGVSNWSIRVVPVLPSQGRD